MEKSFSLQFNPLMNVKSVKEYEDEIAQLKTENFDLKAQLTHSQVPDNIPKILYENKKQIEGLEQEKQELKDAFESIKRSLETISQEKVMLENKYNQDVIIGNEKMGLLEDENKRLVIRLEKLNREYETLQKANSRGILENPEVAAMKDCITTLQNQNNQLQYDHSKKMEEMSNKYEEYQKAYEDEIKKRNFEIESLRSKLDSEQNRLRNSSVIINDLKNNLNTQIKEKSMAREEKISYMDRIEALELENESLRQNKKISDEYLERLKKEYKLCVSGMDKFKSIISLKMGETADLTIDIAEKFLQLKKICYISDENKKFFERIGLNYSSIDDVIRFFREKNFEAQKKLEILKKEVLEARKSASSNKTEIDKKTHEILKQFKEQFGEAKAELMECKRYLEKKAREIKLLKIENARLIQQSAMNGKFHKILG